MGGTLRSITLKQRLTDETVDAKSVIEKTHEGEAGAAKVFADYCLHLTRELANVINIIGPDIIVPGGGLSNIELLYQRVPELWQQFIFSAVFKTKFLQAKYGDSSGIRGAAWLPGSQA